MKKEIKKYNLLDLDVIQMDTHERTQAIQTGEFPEPQLRPK